MKTIGVILVCVLLVGCAPSAASVGTAIAQTQGAILTLTPPATATLVPTSTPAATPTAAYSAELKLRIRDFLTKGSHAAALANQGVTYLVLRDAVADVRGAVDLVQAAWPSGVGESALQDARLGVRGWELASAMFGLKFNDADEPTEPNINKYQDYISFAADKLVIKVRDDSFIVEQYRGKKYLPFDENISILLSIGSDHFKSAQDRLLKIIQ